MQAPYLVGFQRHANIKCNPNLAWNMKQYKTTPKPASIIYQGKLQPWLPASR